VLSFITAKRVFESALTSICVAKPPSGPSAVQATAASTVMLTVALVEPPAFAAVTV